MATGTKPSARLGDKELQKLLELIKGADSVEFKLTVPEQDQRSTVRALGLDPLQAQIRQVFFLDTPELALDQHGLVVRARRSQKRGRLGREAAAGGPVRAPAGRPTLPKLRGRGGRVARRVRLLRVDEGDARARRRAKGRDW